MDGRKFDEVTRTLGAAVGRRGVIKGTAGAALTGLVGLVGARTAGAQSSDDFVRCNSSEKCEAKCGTEDAICCDGKCIRRSCGPDRVLNNKCQCCRVDERGRPTNTGCRAPKFCGVG